MKLKELAKDVVFDGLFPSVYAQAARRPLEPNKAVFVSQKAMELPDNFRLVFDRLRDVYGFDCRLVSLHKAQGKPAYIANCIKMLREVATARFVFLDDASDVISCVRLRETTDVVQLWHACGAFKKFGMSTADKLFGGTREEKQRHPFYENLSLVTVSSPEVAWAYREAMVLEDDPLVVQSLGVSRTDVYFDEGFRDAASAYVRAQLPIARGRKLLLYAPTFRGHAYDAKGPDQLDIPAMRAALGDEWFLVLKHHPFVKNLPEIPDDCKDFACYAPAGVAIDEMLCASDACITDYSSVVFEYALLDRPLLFFAYDVDDYDDWRGFYYDYDEMTPGPVVKTTQEVIDHLTHLDERFDRRELAAFRDMFMGSCDGRATMRICNYLLPEKEPSWAGTVAGSRTRQADSESAPDVSVVVAAYNAQDTLARCIESVLVQTHPLGKIELVVVDDCSTDSTGEIIADFAKRYPATVVALRTASQSGSPAAPRNIGLEAARGEYVFFLDADDWLGEESVERMLVHAREWGSDVLLAKMKGEGGRPVPESMFATTQPRVNVYRSKVLWTFGPCKLFRRTLIEDLRFPQFMPEDISFVLRAYVLAKAVSVAADYDYVHIGYTGQREDHASLTTWDDVESNLAAYEDVFGFIAQNVTVKNRNRALMRRLLKRDVLNTLDSIEGEPNRSVAEGQLRRLIEIVGPFYNPRFLGTLPEEDQKRLAEVFGS